MNDLQHPPRKVTLEQLLRLKSAERPSPEFWAGFDEQLRRKQLAAIVEKRAWWQRLPKMLARSSRVWVPTGAAAAMAIAFVAVRQTQNQQAPAGSAQPVVAQAGEPVIGGSAQTVSSQISQAKNHEVTEVAAATASRSDSDNDSFAGTQPAVSENTVVAAASTRPETEDNSFSRSSVVSAFFAGDLSKSELLASLVGHNEASTFQVASHQPTAASEPLNEIAVARDVRRSRLLAYNDTQDPRQNVEVISVRERVPSRLDEQALADSIRRLGLNGDRVSIKF